jgi:hypothetical protein
MTIGIKCNFAAVVKRRCARARKQMCAWTTA